MAVLASSQTLDEAYTSYKQTVRHLKRNATAWVTETSSGLKGNRLEDIVQYLQHMANLLASYATVTGLAAYAKEQEADANYDVVAEYNTLVTSINDASQWIRDNIPKDANDYALVVKLVDDQWQWRDFTAGQVSGLNTRLQTIANAIS